MLGLICPVGIWVTLYLHNPVAISLFLEFKEEIAFGKI